jgi:hypothetical protein
VAQDVGPEGEKKPKLVESGMQKGR